MHLARCKPLSTMVAVKLVDLEELASSLELLIKEAHTMKGLRHPNVLPLHCSFVADSALWLVMPYIGGGSVSQLLRSQVPCSPSNTAHQTLHDHRAVPSKHPLCSCDANRGHEAL